MKVSKKQYFQMYEAVVGNREWKELISRKIGGMVCYKKLTIYGVTHDDVFTADHWVYVDESSDDCRAEGKDVTEFLKEFYYECPKCSKGGFNHSQSECIFCGHIEPFIICKCGGHRVSKITWVNRIPVDGEHRICHTRECAKTINVTGQDFDCRFLNIQIAVDGAGPVELDDTVWYPVLECNCPTSATEEDMGDCKNCPV